MPLFPALVIPLMTMLSVGGMTYVILKAMHAGAEAYAGEYTLDTARQFEDLFLFIPPERITQVAWASAAAFFMLGFFLTGSMASLGGIIRGAIIGGLASFAALCAPRWLLAFLRQRRLLRFNEQLVDALINMSNALKAGFSIIQAFEAVAKEGNNPISQEFSVFLQQIRVGVRFEDAIGNLERRVASEDLSLMVRSIEVARITGGNLTEVFERIATTIRERMRIEGRIRSLTAQGRLQGIVVGLMPVLLGFALFFMDPRMMMSFVTSTPGLVTLIFVGVLELAGALLIRKIIRIDV